jgi:hypothetical protein
MKTTPAYLMPLLILAAASVSAQVSVTVTEGEVESLAATYSSTDLIQGLIAVELPGDKGWHSANSDPLDWLPAFTDGEGIRASGLTGLLNDFPGAGIPAKMIRYELPFPGDIDEIRVFTGNNGRDGRVFHTYTVRFSTDGAQTFTEPVYVQAHLSGTRNSQWRAVLSQLTVPGGRLATGVTHIDFSFYSVDNTLGEMRDPFDGLNPFTGLDDALSAAFVSPLVWEIDVLGIDSPPRVAGSVVGSELQMTWLTRGASNIVQAVTNLASPAWADLSPQPLIQREGFTNQVRVSIGDGTRFFRVEVRP